MPEREKTGPRRAPKPVTMVMVDHEAQAQHHLLPWMSGIERQLALRSDGEVVVFMEAFRGTPQKSRAINTAIAAGASFLEAHRSATQSKGPATKSSAIFKEQSLAMLDSLKPESRRRIRLVFEEPPPGVAASMDEIFSGELAKQMQRASGTAEYLPLWQYATLLLSDVQRIRNKHMVSQLQRHLDAATVIGSVGWVGYNHTPVPNALHRAKDRKGNKLYVVQRIFPGKHNGRFFFPPEKALRRKTEILPQREVTDEEARLYLQGESVAQAMRVLRADDLTGEARDKAMQAANATAYEWMDKERKKNTESTQGQWLLAAEEPLFTDTRTLAERNQARKDVPVRRKSERKAK